MQFPLPLASSFCLLCGWEGAGRIKSVENNMQSGRQRGRTRRPIRGAVLIGQPCGIQSCCLPSGFARSAVRLQMVVVAIGDTAPTFPSRQSMRDTHAQCSSTPRQTGDEAHESTASTMPPTHGSNRREAQREAAAPKDSVTPRRRRGRRRGALDAHPPLARVDALRLEHLPAVAALPAAARVRHLA